MYQVWIVKPEHCHSMVRPDGSRTLYFGCGQLWPHEYATEDDAKAVAQTLERCGKNVVVRYNEYY